ncbi:transcriptional regulator [Candidatus Moduliflexus flocculans]|uniref:Transcriptional regulator n=1 Tax=Candidatus Moduliflexus flocculans TaxID=1499966 RepID=A0A0S6W0P6_9BACT|nr:transcriptional regulator [Candidatus Moduliflexus flocculans]
MADNRVLKPTLEDVASHSGVSVATVSRVINQTGTVSKDLEDRVKQAIDALGFEPKRPKQRAKPFMLAFVTPELLNPGLTEVTTGAHDEADRLGLCLAILEVTQKPGRQQHNLQMLEHVPFDGVILFHSNITPEEVTRMNKRSSLPIVVLGQSVNDPSVYYINTDRESGMYQATKYLLSLNHKRIAFLSGPPEWELSKARLRGIERALAEAELSLDPKLHRWGYPTIDWGFQVANSLFNLPVEKRPTAVIAFNDLMAIGAIHAIRALGFAVPEDVSVIGFDNIFLTPHTNPPLTTVAQPLYQVGQLAVQKIYNLLTGSNLEQGGFTLLECPLVVRESTALCKESL